MTEAATARAAASLLCQAGICEATRFKNIPGLWSRRAGISLKLYQFFRLPHLSSFAHLIPPLMSAGCVLAPKSRVILDAIITSPNWSDL
jgi:hypothetical protein